MSDALEDDDEFFGNQDDTDTQVNLDERVGDGFNNSHVRSSSCKRVDGLAERDARSTEEQFRNIGYHEAYDQAKEERLQDGFEAGYRQHFDKAMELGELLGEATSPIRQQQESDEANKRINQLVKQVRSFLVNMDNNEEDEDDAAPITTDKLESLTQQLRDVMLKEGDGGDNKK